MSNIINLTLPTTAVDIGDPVFLGRTPHGGGAGREAKYSVQALPTGTAVTLLQGHNGHGTGGAFGEITPPAESDPGWYTVLTINASAPANLVGEIADLPRWVRLNTTTLQAGSPTVRVAIEGVQ